MPGLGEGAIRGHQVMARPPHSLSPERWQEAEGGAHRRERLQVPAAGQIWTSPLGPLQEGATGRLTGTKHFGRVRYRKGCHRRKRAPCHPGLLSKQRAEGHFSKGLPFCKKVGPRTLKCSDPPTFGGKACPVSSGLVRWLRNTPRDCRLFLSFQKRISMSIPYFSNWPLNC